MTGRLLGLWGQHKKPRHEGFAEWKEHESLSGLGGSDVKARWGTQRGKGSDVTSG